MQWTRGDISFIYDGESTQANSTLSVIALDNKKKIYQNLSLASGVCVSHVGGRGHVVITCYFLGDYKR